PALLGVRKSSSSYSERCDNHYTTEPTNNLSSLNYHFTANSVKSTVRFNIILTPNYTFPLHQSTFFLSLAAVSRIISLLITRTMRNIFNILLHIHRRDNLFLKTS
ncbi:hypothetical protein L9F63_013778, partial [Diploptera punctata]